MNEANPRSRGQWCVTERSLKALAETSEWQKFASSWQSSCKPDTPITPEIKRTEEEWPLYGSNQGYHYDGSARFFIRLGDGFATAMLKLMGRK